MSLVRVIPTLLIQGEGLVKTREFKNPVYVGDPINAVRIFNEKEVDELVLLDIAATQEARDPKYAWLKDIVSESFMPIGYGGGIRSADQAKKVFDAGVEKIVLNTASFDLRLVEAIARIYGSQSVVVSIDAKKNFFGGYSVYSNAGKVKHKEKPDEMARNVVNAGAGELVIQSIDREGSMAGYDLELVKSITASVNVPVVASGGAGTLAHLQDAITIARASAVAAGSMFVFKGKHRAVLISYPPEGELQSLNLNS